MLNPMDDDLELWHLSPVHSVIDASLLTINISPTQWQDILRLDVYNYPKGFYPVFSMFKNDILEGRLKAKLVYDAEYENKYYGCYTHDRNIPEKWTIQEDINWYKTTILVDDIKEILLSRNYTKGFYFENCPFSNTPPYLNKDHPFYSARLNACINAWMAIHKNVSLLNKNTPKNALENWLNQNKEMLGLPEQTNLGNVATIANWLDGGSSKAYPLTDIEGLEKEIEKFNPIKKRTKVSTKMIQAPHLKAIENKEFLHELDDDIPF